MSVKQTIGSKYTESFELGHPRGYDGPMDMDKFRIAVDVLFDACVGERANGIRLINCKNTTIMDGTFRFTKNPLRIAFDHPSSAAGW